MIKDNCRPRNTNETSDYIDESVKQVDEQRLSGLQEFKNNLLIKDEVLKRERKRLEEKYGSSHPKVRETESRLKFNQEMTSGVESEIERASIKTEVFDRKSWRIHGRVFDHNYKPVKGVTVFLSDQNKKWIRAAGNSCTNESGYYSLTLDEKTIAAVEKQPLYLSVSDKDKKIIYLAADPLFAAGGIINYKDIFLTGQDCIPPPSDDVVPDSWKIQGVVYDSNKNPLPGLTVFIAVEGDEPGKKQLSSVSDDHGYYSITVVKDMIAKLKGNKQNFLQVADQNQRVIYMGKKLLAPVIGVTDTEDIVISEKRARPQAKSKV